MQKNGVEISKDVLINKEKRRLKQIFAKVNPAKMKVSESLIQTAAFMTITLRALEKIINAEGYTVDYQNGANQTGTKQSDNVKSHIAMTKNLAIVLKQLCDLVPVEEVKSTRLSAFKNM